MEKHYTVAHLSCHICLHLGLLEGKHQVFSNFVSPGPSIVLCTYRALDVHLFHEQMSHCRASILRVWQGEEQSGTRALSMGVSGPGEEARKCWRYKGALQELSTKHWPLSTRSKEDPVLWWWKEGR